ncbi:MAG: hypothetical protein LGR52_04250 [Candidatus Thiosymbion ectosymbiont of Robbea hypermnestra]|nr:hypothetical protein [Candidatus Thiosymbion ectosymbiont of Robbea hypermnestra]
MSRFPQMDSISELADFWQTHDLIDFEDELQEVTEPLFMSPERFAVRLSPADAAALRVKAHQEHVSEADLVSRWVREHLSAG